MTPNESFEDRLRREREETRAKQAEFEALMSLVCAQLGNTWRVKPLTNAEEMRFYGYCTLASSAHPCEISASLCRHGTDKGKIIFGLSYGHSELREHLHNQHGEEKARIGVSLSRGADAIARELKRRFLPVFEARVSRAQADKTNADEREARLTECCNRLIAASGNCAKRMREGYGHNANAKLTNKVEYYQPKGARFEAEIHEGEVRLDLRGLRIEQAEALLAWLFNGRGI